MASCMLIAAAAAGLAVAFTAASPALAHGHGGHHHGGYRGGGHSSHGGHPHHAWGGPHWHGGWHENGWRGGHTVVINRSYPVWGGSRTVVVGRPYPVYGRQYPVYRAAVPVSYGSGCHVSRTVGITPWGWRKIVTTKTCLVP